MTHFSFELKFVFVFFATKDDRSALALIWERMTKGEKIVKNMIAMRKGKIAIYFCNQIQVAVRAKYERRFVS